MGGNYLEGFPTGEIFQGNFSRGGGLGNFPR